MDCLLNINRLLILGLFLFARLLLASELEVVQAQVPPRKSFDGAVYKQTIFEHSFASSYGIPYVSCYSPPSNVTFTTTIFNITVTSEGRQYDRLALLFFGNNEIWRTSTAMPTEDGIYWSYQKDMTVFSTLLRTEQKVIFELDNVYDSEYTGAYDVTLEALYYNDDYTNSLTPPDQILPISNLSSAQNMSSVLSLPDDNATLSYTLPANVKAATVSILASGNSAEEFWYTNVPSEYVNTFPANPGWLYGYSPFREIQLLIDGQLAGVDWPFPSLFTGGVDPGLWRPIVGIDAYDLPTFEIDITPWLPLICDGKSHIFGLKVVGFDVSAPDQIGTVGQNWYVTANIFVWLDKTTDLIATGSNITTLTQPPTFTYHPILTTSSDTINSSTAQNESFYFSLSATRYLSISSSTGTWTQNLSFSNIQNMTDLAFNQSLSVLSSGTYSSSLYPEEVKQTSYGYPLNLYSSYVIAPTTATLSSVYALIDRSFIISGIRLLSSYLSGLLAGKEDLQTRQKGGNHYVWNETIVEPLPGVENDEGSMDQWFSYSGTPGLVEDGVSLYGRMLKEVNDGIVVDEEGWETIEVPSTEPLPLIEGEPVV